MSDADFRRFGQDTSPSGHDVRRLKDRLVAARQDADSFDRLLRELPGPTDGAEARVRARVHQDLRLARPKPRWLVPLGAAVASGALTLSLLLLFARPPRLDHELVADAELPAGLELSIEGEGAIEGTEAAPRIQWRRGTLCLDVDPAAGLQVVVETPEAEVAVIGTAFTVTRGALGTDVSVQRGRVGVRCLNEVEGRALQAGDSAACAPTSAAGLLARARALQGARELEAAVASADQGLAAGPSPAVRTELSLVRVEALAASGRQTEALTAVRTLMQEGAGHRHSDALHVAVLVAGPGAECSLVRPWLEELAEGGARADELGRLADCLVQAEPERAKALLKQALQAGPNIVEQEAIERRLREMR